MGLLPVPACTVCFTLVKLQDDQNKRSTQGPLWNSIPRRFPTGAGVYPAGERQEFTLDRSPVQHRTHTQMEEQFSFSALLAVFWDCGEILENSTDGTKGRTLQRSSETSAAKEPQNIELCICLLGAIFFIYCIFETLWIKGLRMRPLWLHVCSCGQRWEDVKRKRWCG